PADARDEVGRDGGALGRRDVDAGCRGAMTVLARGRLHISAVAGGLMERALDESVEFAAHIRQGGRPVGDYQLVQAMLAEQKSLCMAGRAMKDTDARLWLSGGDRRVDPSSYY